MKQHDRTLCKKKKTENTETNKQKKKKNCHPCHTSVLMRVLCSVLSRGVGHIRQLYPRDNWPDRDAKQVWRHFEERARSQVRDTANQLAFPSWVTFRSPNYYYQNCSHPPPPPQFLVYDVHLTLPPPSSFLPPARHRVRYVILFFFCPYAPWTSKVIETHTNTLASRCQVSLHDPLICFYCHRYTE